MSARIFSVDYYYTTVVDDPGVAFELLSQLAAQGVNLLAFTAVPAGSDEVQFTVFPDEDASMELTAQRCGLVLDGPHPALLIQGIDELGVFAELHQRLVQAGVHPVSTNGLADGSGTYGYIVYLRPEQFERATAALEV